MKAIFRSQIFDCSGLIYLALSLLWMSTWQQQFHSDRKNCTTYCELSLDIPDRSNSDLYELCLDNLIDEEYSASPKNSAWPIYLDVNGTLVTSVSIKASQNQYLIGNHHLRSSISARQYPSEEPDIT